MRYYAVHAGFLAGAEPHIVGEVVGDLDPTNGAAPLEVSLRNVSYMPRGELELTEAGRRMLTAWER